MPNIKSAIKRTRQTEKRRLRNRAVKTRVKKTVREVNEVAAKNTPEEARTQLQNAIRTIEKARSKGVLHAKTASRKISRLTRMVNRSAEKAGS